VAGPDGAALGSLLQALGDANRRAIVEQLSRGEASISELAAPLDITLAAVTQHVNVLEACGLVHTRKAGRVRTCRFDPRALGVLERWVRDRRQIWERKLDRLGHLLDEDEP
jgi:DNA-binding transcriptional ArsR family regulator